jgi:hypothetical protein
VLDHIQVPVIGGVIEAIKAFVIFFFWFRQLIFKDKLNYEQISNGTSQHEGSSALLRYFKVQVLCFIKDSHVEHVLEIHVVDRSHNFVLFSSEYD